MTCTDNCLQAAPNTSAARASANGTFSVHPPFIGKTSLSPQFREIGRRGIDHLECQMKPLFSLPVKTGLAALFLVAGLSAPSLAGPVSVTAPTVPQSATPGGMMPGDSQVVPVREDWAGGDQRSNESRYWRRWNRDHWRGRYNDDWRWRERRHHRNFYGSGFYLGLGVAPAYRYYTQPRRYYQPQRVGNAHVRWCYARYRSYRAWDNTFQPYNGPRQQCWSPYS
jgi:hypothetical protein